MKRRARTNLFLLCLFAVLSALVVLQLRREQTFDRLTTLDPAAVSALVVSCNGCVPRRFEKTNGAWRMLEPLAQPADADAVARLIAISRAPVRARHAAGELDPKKVGLDPPQATLQLDRTVLKFGNTDAIHGDRYVEVDGAIALVPDNFSVRLFATAESEVATKK
jgi:hypothetical protein